MNEEKDRNVKTQLSLAATMFFAPFVKHLLKNKQIEINKEDQLFVDWYVRLWYITIWILLLAIASSLALYFAPNIIFLWIQRISISLLVALLLLWSLGAVVDMKILQEEKDILKYYDNKTDKSDVLFSFFPVYNVYLRYKLHDFNHPFWRAKESILRWTLFIVVTLLTKNIAISGFILTAMIIRLVSLIAWVDILDKTVKNKLNKLFKKNPEEIWAYIKWIIVYSIKKLKGDLKKYDLKVIIEEEKEIFGKLVKINNKTIILEYLLMIIVLLLWISWWKYFINDWIVYIPLTLILSKYLLMIIKLKHLPHLPLIYEIVHGFEFLFKDISTKLTSNKDKKI